MHFKVSTILRKISQAQDLILSSILNFYESLFDQEIYFR